MKFCKPQPSVNGHTVSLVTRMTKPAVVVALLCTMADSAFADRQALVGSISNGVFTEGTPDPGFADDGVIKEMELRLSPYVDANGDMINSDYDGKIIQMNVESSQSMIIPLGTCYSGIWHIRYSLFGNNQASTGTMTVSHRYDGTISDDFTANGPWIYHREGYEWPGRVKLLAERGLYGGGWGVTYYLQVERVTSTTQPLKVSLTLTTNTKHSELYGTTSAMSAMPVSSIYRMNKYNDSIAINGDQVITQANSRSLIDSVASLTSQTISITSTTPSTSSTTGALLVNGGIGIKKDSYINGIRMGKGAGSGNGNTVVGYKNMAGSSSGDCNTSFGQETLMRHTTGHLNSGFGYATLHFVTGHQWNSAFGGYSLYGTKGNYNTGLGARALMWNETGSYNTAAGYMAGEVIDGGGNVTSASNAVYVGANTKASGNGETNTIVIGHGAVSEGSDTAVIGNSSTTSVHLFGETLSDSLKVSGDTVLEGNIVIATPQGDISMGNYQ